MSKPVVAFSRTFSEEGVFAASEAAGRFLTARGFSVGESQRGAPRGVLYGSFCIQKWRNLRPSDRTALHGRMTGDERIGPVVIEIFASAPAEALLKLQD